MVYDKKRTRKREREKNIENETTKIFSIFVLFCAYDAIIVSMRNILMSYFLNIEKKYIKNKTKNIREKTEQKSVLRSHKEN